MAENLHMIKKKKSPAFLCHSYFYYSVYMQPRLSVFVLKWVEMFSYALSRHRNAPQNCNYAKQIAKYSNSVLPLWLFSGKKKS